MVPVEAIIEYGDLSDVPLFDEPDLLVQAMTITPTREKEVWKGTRRWRCCGSAIRC
jgi:hypothetical protein